MTQFKSWFAVILILFIFSAVYALLPKPAEVPRESLGLHYSSIGTREYIENFYTNVRVERNSNIKGLTVNHHLLAGHLIAKQFELISTDKPITVVLLSPNHFLRGQGAAISTAYDWHTPYGVLESDQTIINKLKTSSLVNTDETPFELEHGVSNLVGFIKKSLPNARLVPILVKETMSDDTADHLAETLHEVLPKDAIMIGSFDFSHYLTSDASDFHDTMSISAIRNFDFHRLRKLDVDSQQGLRILLRTMQMQSAQKFSLVSNTNSSKLLGQLDSTETTSYINGYFTGGSSEKDERWIRLETPIKDKTNRLYLYNDELVINPDLVDHAIGYVYEKDRLIRTYQLALPKQ